MRKEDIHSPSDALAYFTDCQLATVDNLAMKKSRAKGDYDRQKRIAQHMCDCLLKYNIKDENSRAAEVFSKFNNSVEEYSIDMEIKMGTRLTK